MGVGEITARANSANASGADSMTTAGIRYGILLVPTLLDTNFRKYRVVETTKPQRWGDSLLR